MDQERDLTTPLDAVECTCCRTCAVRCPCESLRGAFGDPGGTAAGSRSGRQLADIVDLLPDPTFAVDAAGRLIAWNRAIAEMTGVGPESMLGKGNRQYSLPIYGVRRPALIDVALSGGDWRDWYPGIHCEGRTYVAEVYLPKLDGGRRLWVKATVLHDEQGALTGAIECARDITALKRVEHQLRGARDAAREASRAKDRFLTNVSHEIRTPLNGILGTLDLLGQADDRQRGEYIELVRESSHSLLRVMGDILDFSLLGSAKLSLKPEPADIRAVLNLALRSLADSAAAKGLELGGRVDEDLPGTVVVDPDRLRQIVMNLVHNAVKFTAAGRVDVRLAPCGGGDRRLTLELSVTDTGPGVPGDQVERIFEPFEQGDGSSTRVHGGTGLGLSVSRELARLMGGDIRLESTVGEGSTFTVTFPVELPRAESVGSDASPAAPQHQPPPETDDLRGTLDLDRAVERVGGDRALMKEVLGVAREEIPSMLDRLGELVLRDDLDALSRHAHTLKGLFANLAADDARDLACQLQNAAAEGKRPQLPELSQRLDAAARRVLGRADELLA